LINVGVGAKMLEISISKEKENGVGAPCIIKADMIYLNFCSPLPIFERTVLTPLRKLQAKNSSYLLQKILQSYQNEGFIELKRGKTATWVSLAKTPVVVKA